MAEAFLSLAKEQADGVGVTYVRRDHEGLGAWRRFRFCLHEELLPATREDDVPAVAKKGECGRFADPGSRACHYRCFHDR